MGQPNQPKIDDMPPGRNSCTNLFQAFGRRLVPPMIVASVPSFEGLAAQPDNPDTVEKRCPNHTPTREWRRSWRRGERSSLKLNADTWRTAVARTEMNS